VPQSSNQILIVDDETSVRKLLRRCLEKEGFEVHEASNGAEMHSVLQRHDINLVTLDISLGGEDGLDLARELRSKNPVPIIMVSGKGDLIDTVVGLEVGADDYISKPFELREVVARVRAVLRRYQPVDNPPIATTAIPQGTGRWIAPHASFTMLTIILSLSPQASLICFCCLSPHPDEC